MSDQMEKLVWGSVSGAKPNLHYFFFLVKPAYFWEMLMQLFCCADSLQPESFEESSSLQVFWIESAWSILNGKLRLECFLNVALRVGCTKRLR